LDGESASEREKGRGRRGQEDGRMGGGERHKREWGLEGMVEWEDWKDKGRKEWKGNGRDE
jgi:hypothetical protein